MIGLVGLAFMIALTILYHNEIGWALLGGAWLIVLLAPLLLLLGVGSWLVILIQGGVVCGLYFKAKSEG